MSKTGRGIITEYRLDKEYFELGEAYRLVVGRNKYVKAICIKVTDKEIGFIYYASEIEELITLNLTINELMYSNTYEIVKLTEDYEDGKFGE